MSAVQKPKDNTKNEGAVKAGNGKYIFELTKMAGTTALEIERVRLLHPDAAVTMSGPEVVAHADAAKVSSILRNVIDNAMRAAGPHGKVHVVVREQDHSAIAEIWDSGPGVPPSERERIFERLVRLDHGRANDTGGSGLGLAIARGYARAHGGDLSCEDPRGIGAMFRLVLPLEPRQAAIH